MIYEFDRPLAKSPVLVFKEIDNLILKFIWKSGLENKETFGRPILCDFKNSNKATAVKARRDQCNRWRTQQWTYTYLVS